MAYARVLKMAFKSEENLDINTSEQIWFPLNMQVVLIKTTVRPVENAFLLMPTYEKNLHAS